MCNQIGFDSVGIGYGLCTYILIDGTFRLEKLGVCDGFGQFCAGRFHNRMTFRREGVPMGLPGFSEFEVWQTNEANIRAARQALDSL